MLEFHYPFLQSKRSLSSDLAQWRPESLRWGCCWNLPNDSERSACSSIQDDKKKQEKGETTLLQRGSQPIRVEGTSVGSGLLMSYIMNLNFSWDKRLYCIQPHGINIFGDGSQAHRIHLIQNRSCNFPAQSASPLQLLSSARTAYPPLSTWSLGLDSWELSLTHLSFTLN